MPRFDILIRNASEVLTVQGDFRQPADQALAPIPKGAVGISGGKVAFLGPEAELPEDAASPGTELIDAGGGFVGPSFVDPHTHLVFAGERSTEFDLRNQGATYLEIAQAGGGIASTVKATRQASEDELAALARPRLKRLLDHGVTCAEVKSGYGLNLADELKMLRVIRRLSREQPVQLVPTLLCAHAIPEEHRSDRERYIQLCVNEIIPAVAEAGLARFCDAFVEQGAFPVPEARRILTAGRERGLIPRIHADQLTASQGAELAAELGAATADHLENVSEAGVAALAKANVTAVLVPTSTLFIRQRPYASGRRLRDAGVNVALGTNVNPGSAMSESLPLAMGLSCLENGLTAAEAYWAATRGAAIALQRPELGKLEVGGAADLVLFACSTYRHLPYHLGINHARLVLRNGQVVARNATLHTALCA